MAFLILFPLIESVVHLGQENGEIRKFSSTADYCKIGTQVSKISSTHHERIVITDQEYPHTKAEITHQTNLHIYRTAGSLACGYKVPLL